MIVRIWAPIGGMEARLSLFTDHPAKFRGDVGELPSASNYEPGDWIMQVSGHVTTFVCVEVPPS